MKSKFVHVLYFFVLTLVIGVVAAIAANVSVPNVFSPNTVAKSSEVNANFSTLQNALPGIVVNTDWQIVVNTTVADDNVTPVLSIVINAPAAGYVLTTFSGIIDLNGFGPNSSQQNKYVSVALTNSPYTTLADLLLDEGAKRTRGEFLISNLPDPFPNASSTITVQRVFPVSAGTNTIYAYAWSQADQTPGTQEVDRATLTGQYFPNMYGSLPTYY